MTSDLDEYWVLAAGWALALSCGALVALIMIGGAYAAYNILRQPELESLSNIVDEYMRAPGERQLHGWSTAEHLPPIADLPITAVSRLIHLQPASGSPFDAAAHSDASPLGPPVCAAVSRPRRRTR